MDKCKFQLDIERLKCHLENNQLVQANSIITRLEADSYQAVLTDCNRTSGVAVESHPYWPVYKTCLRIKTFILGGKNDLAFSEAASLTVSMEKTGIE